MADLGDTAKLSARAKHTALAQRVPKAPATGNFAADAEAEAQREQLMDIIDNCQWHPRLIAPMTTYMRKILDNPGDTVDGYEVFEKVSTVKQVPGDFWGAFVAQASDFSQSDLVQIRKFDSDAPQQLAIFGTQLTLGLKMPECCMYKPCFEKVCAALHTEVGNRLQGLKAKMTFDPRSGKLDWLTGGCYKLKFTENRLTSIAHVSGCEVEVPAGVDISNRYTLTSNWSDYDAAVQLPPLPPVKLITFFNAQRQYRNGPLGNPRYVGKSKLFENKAKMIHDEWVKDERDKAAGRVSAKNIKEDFKATGKERRKESMTKARAAAAKALSAKRQRRSIQLA